MTDMTNVCRVEHERRLFDGQPDNDTPEPPLWSVNVLTEDASSVVIEDGFTSFDEAVAYMREVSGDIDPGETLSVEQTSGW